MKLNAVLAMLTLLIIPNKEYQEDALRLTKQLSARYEKICYVSLNELYGSLKKTFSGNGIPMQKFFVVDAITRRTDACRKAEGSCFFVSSPNSLIELSLAITDAMRTQGSQLLLFDSVSTLLIYESADIVTKFMHSLVGKVKEAGADSIFIALQSDIDSETVKDLEMFVNETLTMDEYNLRSADKEKLLERTQVPQAPKPKPARRPKLALGSGNVEVGGEPVDVEDAVSLEKSLPKPRPVEKRKPTRAPNPKPAAPAVQVVTPAQVLVKPRLKKKAPQVAHQEENEPQDERQEETEPRDETEN